MKTCRQCGNEIVGRTKRAAFCSYGCKESWHLDKAKSETAAKLAGRHCVVCGDLIASSSGKARTCSRACGVRWQNEKRVVIRRAQWDLARKPCPECGKDIPDTRRAGSIYCSWTCKHRAIATRWRERSPGYMRQYLYGITPEAYAARLVAQDNRCAICRTETPGGKGGWHVDHDHATKAIRGLLCHGCNIALGYFADDPARLRSAVSYLERTPA